MSKMFDDDGMSENYDVILIFADLWLIWYNPEADFWTHGLKTELKYLKHSSQL